MFPKIVKGRQCYESQHVDKAVSEFVNAGENMVYYNTTPPRSNYIRQYNTCTVHIPFTALYHTILPDSMYSNRFSLQAEQ